ncbi:uncharacterized protein LOC106655919 isoform X1 [Trichogramma pretiosum]|uniref:uncharacterized protein LOC106655919 isoform X1 n=1 Tax=Trichogramma pretiosum TaxID=7493 RepID=UPI0006C95275|nr:uncharacterized protein LOC106655919 isoform X1 [Trichogramma pretiosum]
MAFMMPVVKNEWDIYKTNRSRRSSECSNPQACRSRKTNVILTSGHVLTHFGVLQVGRPVVVNIAGFGFSNVTGAPVGAHKQPHIKNFVSRVPELAPIAEQKYWLLATKDRQLGLVKQVSQPARGQAQALAEAGRGQLRRPAQPVVKKSRGFGPTAPVRLETAGRRDGQAHLGTAADLEQRSVESRRRYQYERR